MATYVLILAAISLQTGIILCNDQLDIANLLNRLEAFEKRDNERENERQLWKQQMDDMKSLVDAVVDENRQLKRDIDELNNRITEIESERAELKNELMNIRTENNRLVDAVVDENKQLKRDIDKLNIRIAEIESESVELKNELMNIRTENNRRHEMHEKDRNDVKKDDKPGKHDSGFSSVIQEALNMSTGRTEDRHSISSIVRNTREVSGVQPIRRAENEFGVAFYVRLSNHLLHAGANQNIAFDQIYTNVGNAYNVHAGDFRAPVAGTYVFTTSLTAYGTHTTNCFFARNGANVGSIYVNGNESPNKSSSMTIVLRLDAGDDVAIRNINADEALHTYSSFAGFLLQQDYSAPSGSVIG